MNQLNIDLTPQQALAFSSKRRIVAIISGTGAGKTYVASRWITIKALSLGGEHLAVSPTFPMLKKTLWEEIKRFLREHGIPYDKNEQDMVLRLGNGGVIYGISSDKPERMEGIHASSAVMDEAGQMNGLTWETVRRRVAFKEGQVLIASTPYRWNWLKTDVVDQAVKGNRDIELVNVPSTDNPWYPMARFEEARKSLPEWRFKMMYLGQFTLPAGLIYQGVDVVDPLPIPDDWRKIRGMDFGFNNPAAIIWLACPVQESTWHVCREWKGAGATLDELADILKENPGIITYADPSSKGELETLRRWGIDIRPARKDVLAGIAYVQGLVRQGNLKVHNGLWKTVDELNTYSWAIDANDDPMDVPVKQNDHLMDAMRYALFTAQSKIGSVISGARVISAWSRR